MTTIRERACMTPEQRAVFVLRDVIRSGGRDRWSHLNSHGHAYSTVQSLVRRGLLLETRVYHYEITEAGRLMADGVAIGEEA
jgi:hypothetical protein